MKKLLLVFMMFIIMSFSVAYAGVREETVDDIGNYVAVNLGKNNKGYYKDESFDFKQIKKIAIVASIQKGGASKLTDSEIITKSEVMIKDKINENFNAYLAKTFDDILSEYKVVASVTASETAVDPKTHWKNYFFSNADTIIHIEVLAYNQERETANAAMVFTVYNDGQEVLCYKDFRLNASNSSKEGVFHRIASAFVEKMDQAVSESKSRKK